MKKASQYGKLFICFFFLLFLLRFFFGSQPVKKGASIPYPQKIKVIKSGKEDIPRAFPRYIYSDDKVFVLCRDVPRKQDLNGISYPVTHFIKKFQPFRIKNPLLMWKWVTDNIKYTEDFQIYGRKDVWQFAKTTFIIGQGDCEDSSIMLCDWLRSEGFDAKVVLGKYSAMGWHAWVAWESDEGTYLLEATANSWKVSPVYHPALRRKRRKNVAKLYYPYGLFNEKCYWIADKCLPKRREGHGI